MPHMETIASLVVVIACASAIAGWVATGSEMISYAGLQIAFAFFYSVFQGYAPDTDLDNVRNRVVGILFGLIVTGLVFLYVWPERTIDRFRDALRQALRQLSQLLTTHDQKTPALIGQVSTDLSQARRQAELASFELEELPAADQLTTTKLEGVLARAEEIFASAKSLVHGGERNDERQNQTRTALLSEITTEVQRLN
jgi:multidrug resistance protein MdtO